MSMPEAENDPLQDIAKALQTMQELLLRQDERLKVIEVNKDGIPDHAPSNTQMSRLIGELAKRIPTFSYKPDTEISFVDWYDRYSPIILIDGCTLDDKSKIRLLLENLDSEAYQRFLSHILPKTPSELAYEDVVANLKDIFEVATSIFTKQYLCWTEEMDKEPYEDDQTYGDRVNERFHKYMNDIDLEGLKILRFLVGLKGREDQEYLPYLFSHADKLKESKGTLKLQEIIKELKKLRNYTKDGQLVAKGQGKTISQVNKADKDHKKAQIVCYGCGKKGHTKQECRSKLYCSFCQKTGHKLEQFFKKKNNGKAQNKSQFKRSSHVRQVAGEHKTCTEIEQTKRSVKAIRLYSDVMVNGTPIVFQADTGADVTLINLESWKELGKPTLEPAGKSLFAANNTLLPCEGKLSCSFSIAGETNEHKGMAYVVNGDNLLGLDWMSKSKEVQQGLHRIGYALQINKIDSKRDVKEQLVEKFPQIFESGLGTCTKEKADLKLAPEAMPKYRPARKVPYEAKEAVEKEIDRLLDLGVIEPITYAKWAAPIVAVDKKGKGIRVCADFSTGLNDALLDNEFPLPLPDDIFANLNGGTVFSQIDFSDAYLQVELDDESKELVVINTHKGLFRYNRLPFGIKSAPAIFQSIMAKMCSGLDGVATYLDDVLVTGKSKEEHDHNLLALFERIAEYGFRVRMEKCSFHQNQIKFLGYIVDRNGRKPDPEKISAIVNMKEPQNVNQLKSFLGMISYYGNFLPNIKQFRGILDRLTHKDAKWDWNKGHQQAFDSLIKLLSSDLNLTHYNPNLPLIISADACDYGVGAVIYHRFPNGDEKPIHHISQALTPAEKNYPQIEKEALALVTAVKRFHKYIYGRRFILKTDHKPLLAIYGKKTGLPAYSANRLLRWGLVLLGYNFEIEHVKTADFGNADALSRLMSKVPLENEDVVIAQIELSVNYCFENAIRNLPLMAKDIAHETAQDKILQKVFQFVLKSNWPKSKNKLEKATCPYFERQKELSIVQGCLLLGERVVIPSDCRLKVLRELHSGHPGIVRMKQLARNFCYWPKIDEEIEKFVQSCNNCQKAAKMDIKAPLQPWPTPSRVWERIHIDYAGPVDGNYYLVIVDSLSRWPEVAQTKSISSPATVAILTSIFARNGLPEVIVSDNGTQFVSKEFKLMCDTMGIRHIRTAPYHPQSNGRAECFVDSLKRGFKKIVGEGCRVTQDTLDRFLLAYRSTPSTSLDGKSPAEVFVGRKLRTTLSLMLPSKDTGSSESDPQMKSQFDKKHGVVEKQFEVGDAIWYKKHRGNHSDWVPGWITEVKGKLNYLIEIDRGTTHAHANLLRKRASNEVYKESTWLNTMLHTFNVLPIVPKATPMPEPGADRQGQEENFVSAPSSPMQAQVPRMPSPRREAEPRPPPPRQEEAPRRSQRQRKPPQRYQV